MARSATSSSSVTEELVLDHVRLARSLARRFYGRGESPEDLDAVAQLALVGAAQRYDPERGVAFSSFATVSVLGELKRHFRDRTWAVRAPRAVHDLYLRLGGAREVLFQQLGRSATVSELAAHLGCGEEAVLEAMEAAGGYRPTSLDTPDSADGRPIVESLGGDDPDLLAGLTRIELMEALTILTDRERLLLKAYFFDNRTQEDIARDYACSQMQISRLLAGTLGRLRSRMTAPTLTAA